MPGSDNGDDSCRVINIINDYSDSKNDVKVLVQKSYSCVVCYEPYEKVILTSSQAENVFRAFCKCLKVNSANTAYDFSRGTDFPLCECCSEFSLNLCKLYQKWESLKDKIQEKVEEVLETIIESELARKEEILKIRESQLEDIKQDRKVDSFRKQVIKACDESNESLSETPQNELKSILNRDHDEDNKYSEIFKNFKIKQEIFDNDSDDDDIIICDSDDNDDASTDASISKENVLKKESNSASETFDIKTDDASPTSLFEQPELLTLPSIKSKPESTELCDNVVADSLITAQTIDTINTSKPDDVVNVEINEILKHSESENDSGKSGILTLNYNRVEPVEESDEDSNETTVFKPPTKPVNSIPKVTFEHIFKKSLSDTEEDTETASAIITVPENVVPVTEIVVPVTEKVVPVTEKVVPVTEKVVPVAEKVVPVAEKVVPVTEKRKIDAEEAKIVEPPAKIVRKSNFTSGEKVEYRNGKVYFQNVEIIALNKENSRVKCSLCSTIVKNTKGKNAITKIRTHIIATHYGMYNCPVCNKKCRDSFNLRSHMKTHPYIPEENFACQFCSHTCGSKAGLKMHIVKKHGNESFSSSNVILSIKAATITQSTAGYNSTGLSLVSTNNKPATLSAAPAEPTSKPNITPVTPNSSKTPQPKSAGKKRKRGRPFKNRRGRSKSSHKGVSNGNNNAVSPQTGNVKSLQTDGSESDQVVKRRPGRPKRIDSISSSVSDSSQKTNLVPSTTLHPSSLKSTYTDPSDMDVNSDFVFKQPNPKIPGSSAVKKRRPGRPPKSKNKPKTHPGPSASSKVAEPSLPSKDILPPPPPAPYIALNFSNDSDSEEESDPGEEFFDLSSSKKVDPLSVEEDTSTTSILKTVLQVGNKKTPISSPVKPVIVVEPLTTCPENNHAVTEVEDDDDFMPMVTSTVSLAGNQSSSLVQGIPTNGLPVQNNVKSPNVTTSISGVFRVDGYKPSPHWAGKPIIEKSVPKLVEIVTQQGNGRFGQVAVLSSGTVSTLRCGSCGFRNVSQHDNLAAALKAIKMHIYQAHFKKNNL